MKKTKYLKYALGEIFLVVVGILIALAINQANERYKKEVKEKEYLQSLYDELVTDSLTFLRFEAEFEVTESAARRLARVLEDPQHKITDSLAFITDFRTMINRTQNMPEPVVWQELLNTGNLELIQDRQLIKTLYTHYHRINTCQNDYDNNVHSFVLKGRYFDSSLFSVEQQDDLFDNFRMDKVPDPALYRELINSEEFDHIVHGIVTGVIISRLILGSVRKSVQKPLTIIREKLN